MTVKNFKVGQGLDLDGLVLTNGNGELLVNGNAIAVDLTGYATENYVANAIANSTVDLAPAAGNHIDWNAGTSQFDANVTTIAFDLVNYHNIAQANAIPSLTGYATELYVGNAISNLIGFAPAALDTLQELSTALQDNPNVITSLQSIASGKQNALIEGLGIDLVGNTISANTYEIANAIAGSGITFNSGTGKIEAAPGYISNVTPTFVVTNGQLALSDAITISSVELKDSVANVTAASDVFGNGSVSTYSMGSAVTIGTLPAGTDVADVFVTLNTGTNSRTSKLTYVNTGGDSPTWTEYGIINSGSFPATTISFDSSGNILANVDGINNYSAKGVVTVLK